MARTVEEGHVGRRRATPARISAFTCPTTLGGYFKQFPMQQLPALLQIPNGSDCPHESLFKIGLNSNTRQSSSATKDSHYYYYHYIHVLQLKPEKYTFFPEGVLLIILSIILTRLYVNGETRNCGCKNCLLA